MPDSFVADFSKVKERQFNIKHLPPGEYPAKITKIQDHESKSGNDTWLYTFTITRGPGKGAIYPYYCALTTEQLWKIAAIYAACGITVPRKKVRLNKSQVLNKQCAIVLEDDEYEGKLKSVIQDVVPLEGAGSADDDDVADEDEEEEEAPAPRPAAKKKRPAPAPVEDDDEDEDEDEDDDEPAPPPRPRQKKKAAPVAEDDDDDSLEELEIEDL